MNAITANTKRIELEKLRDEISEIRKKLEAIPADESWEGQVVEDTERHLTNLELTLSDRIESLNEVVFDQIRENMKRQAEWEKTAERAELCEYYDGECTICPRGRTCRGH